MSISKTKKNINILICFLLVPVVSGTIGYFFGKFDWQNLKKSSPASSLPIIEETPKVQLPAIKNADIYVDKNKGIAFQYPKDTHTVRIDSEIEYNKTTNAQIPQSFIKFKGYEAPKVAWALKVEENKPYQGRYGEESPLTPFSMWVFDNTANLAIEEWFEKYWYYPFTWGDASEEIINNMRPKLVSSIDGIKALEADMDPTPRGSLKYIYVQLGTKMYLFQLNGDGTNRSLADQITSSFKFLKTN